MFTLGELTRRGVLRGTAATGGAAALTGLGTQSARATPSARACAPVTGPVTVGRADPRFINLNTSYNSRFAPNPESFWLVWSGDQVVAAVDEAVRTGKRIAVRSGGHCYENFVTSGDIAVVLDISPMNRVSFDTEHQAFSVESGATLGEVYKALYYGWGVTIPGGSCPSVGVGGHIAGGGYGSLSREHGMVVDHLYGVEVVVVDRSGRARRVVATRRPDDPNRDLWWAHTGGGGGNFGVVLRYLLRSPNVRSRNPAMLLPRPPETSMGRTLTWQWEGITEQAFTTLVRDHGQWHERYPQTKVGSSLSLPHRTAGEFQLLVGADAERAQADRLMDDFIRVVTANVGVAPTVEQSEQAWLPETLNSPTHPGGTPFKSKASFLRRRWTDRQIATIHQYLSDGHRWGASVYLNSFGGKINSVAPSATAFPHRDALFSVSYDLYYDDPANTGELEWMRRFYQEVFADTGGVPAPNANNSGCYINYPDADLADPRWNTSNVPWSTLYYRDNYPRLQQAKARWDPRGVFGHALSVRPPSR
ncbi:FAD-binding protein [Streptomyces sp. NPDC005963]|uniref:FAD-binding oxidoreductase n=1 Tax=Streptomyces sp. NPDC005963 TaxID=3156721 RepID=UPI0034008CA2